MLLIFTKDVVPVENQERRRERVDLRRMESATLGTGRFPGRSVLAECCGPELVLTHLGQDDFTIEDVRLNYSWGHSARSPSGGLLLRDNGLTYEEWKVLRWEPGGSQAAQFLPNAADPNLC